MAYQKEIEKGKKVCKKVNSCSATKNPDQSGVKVACRISNKQRDVTELLLQPRTLNLFSLSMLGCIQCLVRADLIPGYETLRHEESDPVLCSAQLMGQNACKVDAMAFVLRLWSQGAGTTRRCRSLHQRKQSRRCKR